MAQNQEYLYKLSMLEQQASQLQEQIQQINQQVSEFEILKSSLFTISKEKNNKEILSPLGRGIFFTSQLKDKKLLVSVGANIVLKKSPQEAGKIINKQISSLNEIKQNLISDLEKLNHQLREIILQAQQEK